MRTNPLTRKLGPLPAWAWAGVVVGAYLVYAHSRPADAQAAGLSLSRSPDASRGADEAGQQGSLEDLLAGQQGSIDALLAALLGTSASQAAPTGGGGAPGASSQAGPASEASSAAAASPEPVPEPAPVDYTAPSEPAPGVAAFATPGGGYSLEDPKLPGLIASGQAAADDIAAKYGPPDPWMVAAGLSPPTSVQSITPAAAFASSPAEPPDLVGVGGRNAQAA